MSVVRGLLVEELLKRGSIKDVDVARFRRALHEHGVVSGTEAETLFAINDSCRVQDSAWCDLFIEAIADFIVVRAPPEGYITVENAAWLIARISRDGRVDSKSELELLARVLQRARWAPESLCLFALDQVKRAVVSGEGPLRAGQTLVSGRITNAEVDLVRGILFAFAGSGNIAITENEAEALLEIEESLREGDVNPAWTDLFVKAIANALMAASGHKVPVRAEALRREDWIEGRGEVSPPTALTAMVRASLAGIWSGYSVQSREERAIEQLERRRIEIITSEEITPVEASWLASRLTRDGKLTANEAALLQVLKAESPRIGAALNDLVGRIGVAA